jgi:hypothetical protein
MKLYFWSMVIVAAAPLLVLAIIRLFTPLPMLKLAGLILAVGLPVALVIPWVALRFSVEQQGGDRLFKGGPGYRATVSPEAFAARKTFPDAAALGDSHPALRTNGIGLPGLAVGKFRLRDGRSAVMFVHDANAPVVLMDAKTPPGSVVIVNTQLLERP